MMTIFFGIMMAVFVVLCFVLEELNCGLEHKNRCLKQELTKTSSALNKLLIENSELESEILDSESAEDYITAPPYIIYVKKSKDNQLYITLCYRSNKKVFMQSETYKNKSFGLKKAEELTSFLNCELVEL